MWGGIATQVRTHRTHGTQKIRRLRQDATPADQTQDLFLLMMMSREYYSSHFLVAYALAASCFDSWISELITPYFILLLVCRHLGRIFNYGAKCLKAGPLVKQEFRGNRSELSPELPRQL